MSDLGPRPPSLKALYEGRAKPRRAPVWPQAFQALGLTKGSESVEVDRLFVRATDVMNDLHFGPGQWSRIKGPDRARLLPGLESWGAQALAWEAVEWIRVPLTFYSGVFLWQFLFTETERIIWLLEGPDRALVLDGTEEKLWEANRTFSLHLEATNVTAYLNYFSATTATDDRLGLSVQGPNHPLWVRFWNHRRDLPEVRNWVFPPRILEFSTPERYRVEVSELLNSDCYHTVYHLYPSGTIERGEDLAMDTVDLAELLLDRGRELQEENNPQRALEAFSRALEILEATEADQALGHRDVLARALLHRALARDQGLDKALLPDLDRALALLGEEPQGPQDLVLKASLLRARVRHATGDRAGAVFDLWHYGSLAPANPETRDPFMLTWAEMNDQTFGKGSWEPAAAEPRLEGLLVHRIRLPFYPDIPFWQVVSEQIPPFHRPLRFLEGPKELIVVDGKSDAIHDANDTFGVVLSADTVVPYLKFFCTFVEGEEGPFFIVEDADHPALIPFRSVLGASLESIRPVSILGQNGSRWQIAATVLYGEILFRSIFELKPNGTIEMVGDEPL